MAPLKNAFNFKTPNKEIEKIVPEIESLMNLSRY
jgi:hypothetical protein